MQHYGKMSLSNVIDDHKRMIALYETAEEVLKNGENEELLMFLASERSALVLTVAQEKRV